MSPRGGLQGVNLGLRSSAWSVDGLGTPTPVKPVREQLQPQQGEGGQCWAAAGETSGTKPLHPAWNQPCFIPFLCSLYWFSNSNTSRGLIILCLTAESNNRNTKGMGESLSTPLCLEIPVLGAGCLQEWLLFFLVVSKLHPHPESCGSSTLQGCLQTQSILLAHSKGLSTQKKVRILTA